MDKTSLLVVGAGGHSKIVSEIATEAENIEIVGYVDEQSDQLTFLGKEIFSSFEAAFENSPTLKNVFVAIGSNVHRERWQLRLKSLGLLLPTLQHPTSAVAKSAVIGEGSIICANAVVGPFAQIGAGTIINSGAVVEHDAVLGDFVHISQGAVVCGGARVGSRCELGPNTVVEKLAIVPNHTVSKSCAVFTQSGFPLPILQSCDKGLNRYND